MSLSEWRGDIKIEDSSMHTLEQCFGQALTQPGTEVRTWPNTVAQAWFGRRCNPQNGAGDQIGTRSLLDRAP